MPKFLHVIPAICQRCGFKMPAFNRVRDGNIPGLWVHPRCRDNIDPYRLPPHPIERLAFPNPRPDVALTVSPDFLITNQGPGNIITAETGDKIEVTE